MCSSGSLPRRSTSKGHYIRTRRFGQCEADFLSELIRNEWLANDAGVADLLQRASVGKAGDEENRQAGTLDRNPAGKVLAIHSRHGKIEQRQLDGILGIEKIEGVLSFALQAELPGRPLMADPFKPSRAATVPGRVNPKHDRG
jgi:hypothetical protein